jgi:ribosomal protein S18 acetylase RimI-like enzyme
MVITQLSSVDLPLLERAVRQFRGVEGGRTFVETPGALVFVATGGDGITGWCWGHHMAPPDSPSMLYLHELEVVEEHRRLGIGRALLEAFMAAGRKAGASKMFLFTAETNTAARSLYESMGGGLADHGGTLNYWFVLDS